MLLMFRVMTLKEFLKKATKRERAEVAVACNHSVAYLYQIAGGHRHASPMLAVKIEALTEKVAFSSGGRLHKVQSISLVRCPQFYCCCCSDGDFDYALGEPDGNGGQEHHG